MENLGIGTDIVEVRDFKKYNDPGFSLFLQKNFSRTELDYCLSMEAPAPHLAARFAGKEAVIKALHGLGITSVFYSAIEILNDNRGVPYVRINTDEAEKISIKISLSHTAELALAFCLIIHVT